VSPDETSIDPDQIGCQLVLVSPPSLDPAAFGARLDEALTAGGIAAFLLRLEGDDASARHAAAEALRPVCARHATALLVQDDIDLALSGNADGVQLSDPGQVEAARRRLGPEGLLGVACGASRDTAMAAGEAGSDYVAFGAPDRPLDQALLDILRWWQDLFVLPCLAEGVRSIEDCRALAQAGADLVAVPETVWNTGPDPAAEVGALHAAIAAN
jgi:thiamine-phosphate pyrophosphorylase